MKELGRQVYLGGYEHEEHAAEAYDVAALKCKGFKVKTNFDIDRQAMHSDCLCTTRHANKTVFHTSVRGVRSGRGVSCPQMQRLQSQDQLRHRQASNTQ